ncbi:MAG TPA: redox-sensing transcriptional repressor Rex [Dehalococcoidia bacterium]|jgi:redox-sensing transcriptional repressor|nr:redox-sensing transcriptional repressor Rex [Dehalococcoidia bacterium]
MPIEIPDVVIDRLPVYARALALLERSGREVVSSQELGAQLGVTPAQIRKDLSYFGRFGKQGRGYNVKRLLEELRQILGLDREWTMVLVGVGQLGRAILAYGGFAPQGFRIVGAFDSDPAVVGEQIGDLRVQPVSELPRVLRDRHVDIGIVSTPAAHAQEVIDALVAGGVRSILNYAPIAAHVPRTVHIKDIDPVLALQSMTFYLKSELTAAVK